MSPKAAQELGLRAGIVLAIVMVVPYHIFMNMGEQIHLEIEEAAAEVLEFVSTEMEKPKV